MQQQRIIEPFLSELKAGDGRAGLRACAPCHRFRDGKIARRQFSEDSTRLEKSLAVGTENL